MASSANVSRIRYREAKDQWVKERKGRKRRDFLDYDFWKEQQIKNYQKQKRQRDLADRKKTLELARKRADEQNRVFVRKQGENFRASSYDRMSLSQFQKLKNPENYAVYTPEDWYRRAGRAKPEGTDPKPSSSVTHVQRGNQFIPIEVARQKPQIANIDGDRIMLETKQAYDARTEGKPQISTFQEDRRPQSFTDRMRRSGHLRKAGTPESTLRPETLRQLRSGELRLKGDDEIAMIPTLSKSGGLVYELGTKEAAEEMQRIEFIEDWNRKRVFSGQRSPIEKYTGPDALKLPKKKPVRSEITAAEKPGMIRNVTGKVETAVVSTLTQDKYRNFQDFYRAQIKDRTEAAMPYLKGAADFVISPAKGAVKSHPLVTSYKQAGSLADTYKAWRMGADPMEAYEFNQKRMLQTTSPIYDKNVRDFALTLTGMKLLKGAPAVAKLPGIKATTKFGKMAGTTALLSTSGAEPYREKGAEVIDKYNDLTLEKASDWLGARGFGFTRPISAPEISSEKKQSHQSAPLKDGSDFHKLGDRASDIYNFSKKATFSGSSLIVGAAGEGVKFGTEYLRKPIQTYAFVKGLGIAGQYLGAGAGAGAQRLGLGTASRSARLAKFGGEALPFAGVTYQAAKDAPEGQKLRTALEFASMPLVFKGGEVAFEGGRIGINALSKDFHRQYTTDPTATFIKGKSKKGQGFAPREQVASPQTPPRINPEYKAQLKNIEARGKDPASIKIETFSKEDALVKQYLKESGDVLAGSRNFYNQLQGKWETKGRDWDIHATDPGLAANMLITRLSATGKPYELKTFKTDSGKVYRITSQGREVVDLAPRSGTEKPVKTGEGINLQSLSQEMWTKARTYFEPAKTTGRAREKDIPKLIEGLQATDHSIKKITTSQPTLGERYLQLVSEPIVKQAKASDVVYYEDVAWHTGDFSSQVKGGTLTPKILTPTKAENIYGEGSYPILYFGQNERLSFFYKGSGRDTLKLTDKDVKFNRLAELPKEFQKPTGRSDQAKAYLDWVSKNKPGEIVPSAKTIAGIDFKTGKPTKNVEKEWIVVGDIKNIEHSGFMLDYYSPWGQKYKKVYTKETAPRAQPNTIQRIRQNVPEIMQDITQVRRQRQSMEKSIRKKSATGKQLDPIESAYLESIRGRSSGLIRLQGGIPTYSRQTPRRGIERPIDYTDMMRMAQDMQGMAYRETPNMEKIYRARPEDTLRNFFRTGTRMKGRDRPGLERTPSYTPDYRTPDDIIKDITRDRTPPGRPGRYPPRAPGRPPERTPGRPPTKPPGRQRSWYEKLLDDMGKSGKGFQVEIRKQGKWQTVTPYRSLNYIAALSQGARAVEKDAAASFRLKPSDMPASRQKDIFFLRNLQKYRRAKSAKDVFVEKDIYRINTPGELRQITARGITASRQKQPNDMMRRYRKLIGG